MNPFPYGAKKVLKNTMQTRTVQVTRVSDLAIEREIHEFFSFSGEIEHIEILAAERKLNVTGSAVKSSRYVTAGTAWLNGALNKVAKTGQVAGTKTREKWNTALSNLSAKDPPIAA